MMDIHFWHRSMLRRASRVVPYLAVLTVVTAGSCEQEAPKKKSPKIGANQPQPYPSFPAQNPNTPWGSGGTSGATSDCSPGNCLTIEVSSAPGGGRAVNGQIGQPVSWTFTARTRSGASRNTPVFEITATPQVPGMTINGNGQPGPTISWTPDQSAPSTGTIQVKARDQGACEDSSRMQSTTTMPGMGGGSLTQQNCSDFRSPNAYDETATFTWTIAGAQGGPLGGSPGGSGGSNNLTTGLLLGAGLGMMTGMLGGGDPFSMAFQGGMNGLIGGGLASGLMGGGYGMSQCRAIYNPQQCAQMGCMWLGTMCEMRTGMTGMAGMGGMGSIYPGAGGMGSMYPGMGTTYPNTGYGGFGAGGNMGGMGYSTYMNQNPQLQNQYGMGSTYNSFNSNYNTGLYGNPLTGGGMGAGGSQGTCVQDQFSSGGGLSSCSSAYTQQECYLRSGCRWQSSGFGY